MQIAQHILAALHEIWLLLPCLTHRHSITSPHRPNLPKQATCPTSRTTTAPTTATTRREMATVLSSSPRAVASSTVTITVAHTITKTRTVSRRELFPKSRSSYGTRAWTHVLPLFPNSLSLFHTATGSTYYKNTDTGRQVDPSSFQSGQEVSTPFLPGEACVFFSLPLEGHKCTSKGVDDKTT